MKKTITLFLLLFAMSLQVFAQDRTITGTVSGSRDKATIPGITVSVPGTTIAAATDIDGKYSITVPPATTTLRFTGIGYKVKDVPITASNELNVQMDDDLLRLDEVVVTANAIKREKRSLGFATQQVTSEELTKGGNSSFIGSIQGKVSGVQINSNSGAVGSSQRVVIRGGTSITSNNNALFVVDGLPIDNSNRRNLDVSSGGKTYDDLNNQTDFGNRANDINPNDIESITVLKGPTATALYGSRASNGAIIITTKSGKKAAIGTGKSKSSILINSKVTFSSVLKFPEFQNTYGQGDVDNVLDDRRENFSWGLPFDGKLRPWGQEIDGKQRVKPYSAVKDNVKDFFDTGVAFENYISMSGGTEKSAYNLSLSSLNSNGIVPDASEYDKYSIHFNGTNDISDHFSSSITLNYTNIGSDLPAGGQREASIYDQVLQTPRDIPITESKDLTDPFNGYNDATGQYGFYGAYTTNPYFVLANFKTTNEVDRVFGTASLTYSNWGWLSITNRFGGDFYADRRYQKWKKYSYEPIDPFYIGNPQIYQGKYSEDVNNYASYNNDFMVSLNHEFTKDLKATLLLGQNVRQETNRQVYAQTNPEGGLGIPGYYNLQNSNGFLAGYNFLTQKRIIGYYGDLNFSYKNMLFLGLTGRNDKSSTLPEDKNSYFYPSVNASWIFTELMKGKLKDDFITYGKLRANWSKVGLDAPAYSTGSYYESTVIDGGFGSTVFPFDGINGYTQSNIIGNPELTPEFTTSFEIGTELGLLKDRVSFDFTYYENRSTDAIIQLAVPQSSGYTSKFINAGERENKGIEMGLRLTPIVTASGFKWEVYGSYTKNKGKVVSLGGDVQQLLLGGSTRSQVVAQVGVPYGAIFAVDLLRDPNGNVVVDSSTGMPRVTPNLIYKGSYEPKYLASIGSNITYKNITFGFLFDIKKGGIMFSRTKDIMDFVGTAKETEKREDYVWEGSVYQDYQGNYVTNSTAFHPYDYYTNVIPDGQHIIDASYVKLREASLAYSLPSKWLGKTPFGSCTIALFGNNLLLWTPKENEYVDPEQNSSGSGNVQGFEFTSNPSVRNYGFDLKLTF